MFTELYYIDGCPSLDTDLLRAGINTADKAIFFAHPYGGDRQQEDVNTIMKISAVKSLGKSWQSKQQDNAPDPFTMFEFVDGDNIL